MTILQASSTQFSIQYATGAVYGNLAYDTVRLGGISIPNQALGVVRQAGKELLQSSCDGIIVSCDQTFGAGWASRCFILDLSLMPAAYDEVFKGFSKLLFASNSFKEHFRNAVSSLRSDWSLTGHAQ